MSEQQTNAFVQKSRHLRSLGRPHDAVVEMRKALTIDPRSSMLHAILACDLAAIRELDEALAVARRAVELDPSYDYAFYSLAQTHVARSDWQAALAAIDEAIRLDASDADNHSVRSTILKVLGRLEESERSAREALSNDPEQRYALDTLADVLRAQAKLDDAQSVLLDHLKRRPDDDIAHSRLGWLYLQRDQYDDAIQHFREALRIDPNNNSSERGLTLAIELRDRPPIT